MDRRINIKLSQSSEKDTLVRDEKTVVISNPTLFVGEKSYD